MDLEAQLWMEGLNMTAAYINGQGGIRMGEGKVGYVNLTFTEFHVNHTSGARSGDAKMENYYVSLCNQPHVDVLLLPLPRDDAKNVVRALKEDGNCKKPVLTGSSAAEIFEQGYSNVWSPVKRSTEWAADHAEFLYGLGARDFVVVGEYTTPREWQSVKDTIEKHA
eukprot:COSAG02_NODE_17241_length_1018_cov_2.559304_2_plen_165_part_01